MRILWIASACAISLGSCFVNEALSGVQKPQPPRQQPDKQSDDAIAQPKAKLRMLGSLPIGIKIEHSPNPARARIGGRSGFNFTWPYKTSVQTIAGSVKIEEFGAFAWENGRWVFSNFTGKPYSPADFAEWYSCPDARLLPGRQCSDANNWSGRRALEPGKTKWYFIGVNSKGKRVKGEAVIVHLPSVTHQFADKFKRAQ